jgi:hypothetical protein
MKNFATLTLVPLLALVAGGCSDNGGGGTPANPPAECVGKNVRVAEKFNYQFSSTLTFPPTKVQPKTELSFDWSGVSRDFLGHPVDPKNDITMVSVLSWGLPRTELEEKLNADTLLQKDLTVVPLSIMTNGMTAGIDAGTTSAKLFQFTLNGEPITENGSITREAVLGYFDADDYPPDYTTYTLMAASGDVLGQGTRMIQSFILDKGSTNTEIKMTPAATQLKWSANIHDLVPSGIPAGEAGITVDWSDSIQKNALGGEFDPTMILHVLVGRYSEDVGQLEKKFLDIELIATELYRGDVLVGTNIDLSTLTDEDGNTFKGIDSSGTWLLALQCGVCHNPAPWYLTLLEPMDGCS